MGQLQQFNDTWVCAVGQGICVWLLRHPLRQAGGVHMPVTTYAPSDALDLVFLEQASQTVSGDAKLRTGFPEAWPVTAACLQCAHCLWGILRIGHNALQCG